MTDTSSEYPLPGPSLPLTLLTSVVNFLGFDDARFYPSDWSFERNPFWTSFLFTLIILPCLFYLTWYLNPQLSKNRLGLSWVLGFYSAIMFTIAGFYEIPHLKTIFNSAVDYPSTDNNVAYQTQSSGSLNPGFSAPTDVCLPVLKAGAMTLMSTLPSFLRLEPDSYSKYFCFSDLARSDVDQTGCFSKDRMEDPGLRAGPFGPINTSHIPKVTNIPTHRGSSNEPALSLRHSVYQSQMKKKHLFFSLENYPDDGRIGPHIIAANFQAFLIVDLVLGLIHYRRQLEPFSTVVHHIIYFFIVTHMRAGDMLSVFCVLGTPIEASSIFLAFGRIFPHHRTSTVERLYLACFITTRLMYVSLLWHEVYFNYPDKSVAVLYTITILLHVYWFVLYTKTQKRFQAKQRRQHVSMVLRSLAMVAKEEFVASENHLSSTKPSPILLKNKIHDFRSDIVNPSENRLSVEINEIEFKMPQSTARQGRDNQGGAQF
ncbi:hypothetical protein BGZ76_010348 [Entomortierella beljakovae]|nr:hypothetical protein BGZ76_010348 [Entomortierella beljakovae]